MLIQIDQLPAELDRRRFGAELYDLGRRADAGLPNGLILPLVAADGAKTRCLIADEAAHATRARGSHRAAERAQARFNDEKYAGAFALYADDDSGGAA